MSGSPRSEHPLSLTHNAHQQLIGYLGLLMPVLLLVLSALRPEPNLRSWPPLDSVSAYYYSSAVAIFVGVLFGLAFFLMTYRGYSESWEDRLLARVGAVAALCVAIFPTEAPDRPRIPGWWVEGTEWVHYIAAAVLFVTFILFSLWLFRRTDVPKGKPLPPDKRRSNRIYLICGLVMVASVTLTFILGIKYQAPIFIPETITLWAFAVSWLVKGCAPQTVVAAVKRMSSSIG